VCAVVGLCELLPQTGQVWVVTVWSLAADTRSTSLSAEQQSTKCSKPSNDAGIALHAVLRYEACKNMSAAHCLKNIHVASAHDQVP
jgi:hypothetical protein